MAINLSNEKIKYLKSIIKKKENYQETINKLLELHSLVHLSEVSDSARNTYADLLWDNLDEETMKISTNEKHRTIVYGIWHSARIEDITPTVLNLFDVQLPESLDGKVIMNGKKT